MSAYFAVARLELTGLVCGQSGIGTYEPAAAPGPLAKALDAALAWFVSPPPPSLLLLSTIASVSNHVNLALRELRNLPEHVQDAYRFLVE